MFILTGLLRSITIPNKKHTPGRGEGAMTTQQQISNLYSEWMRELERLTEQVTGASTDLFDAYTGFSHHEFSEDFILGRTPAQSLEDAIDTLICNWKWNLRNIQTPTSGF